MSPLVTWALVVLVLAASAVATSGGVPRKVRGRERRVRATSEGATRRRTAVELQVPDWASEGWLDGSDTTTNDEQGRTAA